MKVCLSNRQSAEYLAYADEIKFDMRDRNSILDVIEKYPDKTIILKVNTLDELPWNDFVLYKKLAKDNFILCLNSMENMLEAKKRDFKFYYGYGIYDFETLEVLKNIGVCYVRVEGSLFFDMPAVKEFGIPVRLIPNVPFDDGWPRENGIAGTWIRPEDLDKYEEFAGAVEFDDCNVKKEQALYRIYIASKHWPSALGILISDFNYLGNNLLLPEDFTERRLTCRQKCKRNPNSCHYCKLMLDFASTDFLKQADKAVKEKK